MGLFLHKQKILKRGIALKKRKAKISLQGHDMSIPNVIWRETSRLKIDRQISNFLKGISAT